MEILGFFFDLAPLSTTPQRIEQRKKIERNDENWREKHFCHCEIKLNTNDRGRAVACRKIWTTLSASEFIKQTHSTQRSTQTHLLIFRVISIHFSFPFLFFAGNNGDDDHATNEFAKRVLSAQNHDDDCQNNFGWMLSSKRNGTHDHEHRPNRKKAFEAEAEPLDAMVWVRRAKLFITLDPAFAAPLR